MVDRFKVARDLKQRLAESFETALELADGVARVELERMDDGDGELVFSRASPAPSAATAMSELEPRMFSFNNPAGACPECDGLGVRTVLRSGASSSKTRTLSPRRGRDPRLGPAQRPTTSRC